MTSAIALARVRTLLDESSSGFWSDDEIYRALTSGQNELINYKISEFKSTKLVPEILRPLIENTTGAGTANLPSDYLHYIDIYVDSTPVFVRDITSRSHYSNNSFLASASTQPYCYFTNSQIVFETSVNWTMDYIKKPTDISVSQNPTLDDRAMNAVLQYAFAELLKKDSDARANNEFVQFLQLVQSL